MNMTPEERERKIRELIADHYAAGGHISREEAERIIDEVAAAAKAAARSAQRAEIRGGKAETGKTGDE
jgi:polyhydroxyalkanoate synthesis regulator phasin